MKKWLTWGIPAVLLMALIAWRFKVNAGNAAQTSGAQRSRIGAAASVEVATATSRVITDTRQSVGNVQSPYKVEISPKTTGRIDYLVVREGDPVKAGEVVLKIDPSDLKGALVQAMANVADARSKLAQANLTKNATFVGVSSQVKQQRAAVTSAQADLTQIRNNYASSLQQAQALVDAAVAGVTNARAALTKEQANLANAQTRYDRTYKLYQQAFVAAQDVDDARTTVDVEKGAVGVQQALLSSAQSQLNSQQQNYAIVKRKGVSDIADSQAKLDQAKAILATAVANTSQGPAYEEQLVALQDQVSAARAAQTQAQARLDDTVIHSSITGTVTARKADPGALASPGTPVLEVQYLDWVYVTTTLPIELSGQVHASQQARITFDGLPGRTFVGPISNVNPSGDPQSRAFGIMIRLDNKDHALRPGMYGQVSITLGQVNAAVTVPREAITTNPDGTTTVTVVDSGNVAHVRQVKLGASDDKGYQVLDGIQPGEKVVVLSYTPVKDGGKVSIGKPGGPGGAGGKGKGGRGSGQGRRKGGGGTPGVGQ